MNVAVPAATAIRNFEPRQIALIKNTVAKDTNADEFNLFVEVARNKGLDPFLGQIIPMVFSKDNAAKRKLTIIISRDGQRVIAQRCGDYRPASKPAEYLIDPDKIDPATNPKGIITATVYLWKQDPHSKAWYEVCGQADWDEFAPLTSVPAGGWKTEETGETWQDSGRAKTRRVPVGEIKQQLDDSGNWARMPKLMIAKCAEMQALRAGWPEQFSGFYDEAELHRAKILDANAAEVAENFATDQRLALVNAQGTIPLVLDRVEGKIEFIAQGQFADTVLGWLKDAVSADDITAFEERNQNAFKQFWALEKADALALRKSIDARKAELPRQTVDA